MSDDPKPAKVEYPKWVHHDEHPSVIVQDEEEHKALLAARAPKQKPAEPVADTTHTAIQDGRTAVPKPVPRKK